MSIADRLGLVVHWIGFGCGLFIAVLVAYNGYQNILYVRTVMGELDYSFLFESFLLLAEAFLLLLLPLMLGWLIRYVLSGKVHILPFK